MADVLGKYSFLETPDVNGINVLLNGGNTPSIQSGPASSIPTAGTIGRMYIDTTNRLWYRDNGISWDDITAIVALSATTNQTTITQATATTPAIVGIANDAVLPGTGAVTIPSGTTAQRPAVPLAGMIRYNTSTGHNEWYDGTNWIVSGAVLQKVTGNITQASSNLVIPYDNTVPLSTEGFQVWSASFTPILANSTIYIETNSFFVINSANDISVSGATFSGTTCINAQVLGFGTTVAAGNSFSTIATEISGSTAARTYSFRAGPNSSVVIFYGRGVTATFGGTVSTGIYTITEVAP